MNGRFDHYRHVKRVLALFATGFAGFLMLRWMFVPADFGTIGFYRAGALVDAQARPLVYAGETTCLECHGDVGDARAAERHARVRCEACHGPLARHSTGDFEFKPKALNPRQLCLQCHTRGPGKPDSFPQVLVADHAPEGACTECHSPHRPRIQ